jgi:hypothetical protein
MIFAEFTPSVPWPITAFVALGMIGLLGIYVLVGQSVIVTRKAFGKHPPMHEQIAAMRKEFVEAQSRHESEIEELMRDHEKDDAEEFKALEKRIDAVDTDVRSFRQEVSRNGDQRKADMLAHIDRKHTEVQAQLNDIHTAIGEVRGELKVRNS